MRLGDCRRAAEQRDEANDAPFSTPLGGGIIRSLSRNVGVVNFQYRRRTITDNWGRVRWLSDVGDHCAGDMDDTGTGVSPHKRELIMTDQPQQPEVIDPDNVPETLCEGMFNISFTGPLAVITFTHPRPEAGPLFTGTVNPKLIVRSRIVTSVPNLVVLRDLLNSVIASVTVVPAAPAPAPATGGPTRH